MTAIDKTTEKTAEDRSSHTVFRKMYQVSTGSISCGFTFYGMFKDVTSAHDWALKNLPSQYTVHYINKVPT